MVSSERSKTISIAPKHWSILNKTIPHLLGLNERQVEKLWILAAEKTVSDIFFFTDDEWRKMAEFGFLQEDGSDVFLPITFDYIVNLKICPVLFEKLYWGIASLAGIRFSHYDDNIYSCLPDEAIITEEEIEGIQRLRIDSFDVPRDYVELLNSFGLQTWEQIAGLGEKSLLISKGLSIGTIHVIQVLWNMKRFAFLAKNSVYGPFVSGYSNFADLMRASLELVCEKERDREIVLYRLGLKGNGNMTLDEIGEFFGLTRERIRQIYIRKIEKNTPFQKQKTLAKFWIAVSETLRLSGGACFLNELADGISRKLEWNENLGINSLALILKLNKKLVVDRRRGIVYDPDSQCLNCEKTLTVLGYFAERKKDAIIISQVLECLMSMCRKQIPCECRERQFGHAFAWIVADVRTKDNDLDSQFQDKKHRVNK